MRGGTEVWDVYEVMPDLDGGSPEYYEDHGLIWLIKWLIAPIRLKQGRDQPIRRIS